MGAYQRGQSTNNPASLRLETTRGEDGFEPDRCGVGQRVRLRNKLEIAPVTPLAGTEMGQCETVDGRDPAGLYGSVKREC